MKFFNEFAKNGAWALLSLLGTGIIIMGSLYFYMSQQLPNVESLKNVQLQVPLRVYTSDGKLIGEFGEKRRIPIKIDQVPKLLIDAILATEDQRYYEHAGVDLIGLIRAAKALVVTGKKTQGASTITMQVARNFFLTRKKTYTRKINEILLALKIDSKLSKQEVLQLYLNKIYLGQRAYGVAAAAQVYYGKPLDKLDLAQLAMIAGLPQAPSAENPISNPVAAKKRRDHVLYRMYELGYISKKVYEKVKHTPLTASYHGPKIQVKAPYIAEMVRSAIVSELGDAAYTNGLKVYTTINSKLQQDANKSLQQGLLAYDERHGYHGAEENLGRPSKAVLSEWQKKLKAIPKVNGLLPAAVLQVRGREATALLADGKTITIPWAGMSWARRYRNNRYLGPKPTHASQILKPGDVIRVEKTKDDQWKLTEIPKVEGAIVALKPQTGAILALTGGFSYSQSHFNRAIQAERQPGSSFKPFIYAAALAKGYTLASIINDAPVVLDDPSEENLWRPQNDTLKFYGPTRLRIGLIKSRNLVSIRLLRNIGIPYALGYISRFGFDAATLPHSLSLALGSGVVTPMQMATGFAVFANGGYKVTPYYINRIVNEKGKEVYQAHSLIACNHCANPNNDPLAPQVISPQIAYLMTNAMQDVIQNGTGRRAKVLHRTDLAGKTGTTNNKVDAWFSGFNSDIVTTVWVGFDQPHSLYEYGAQAALPIWIHFMGVALKGKPEDTMPQPAGIVTARIDPSTGLLAYPGQHDAVFELFRQEYLPTETSNGTQEHHGNHYDETESDNDAARLF